MTASVTNPASACNRRAVLRAGVGAAVGTAALGAVSQPAAAAEDPDEFEAWLEDVENFDGIVDRRGESTVTITVGAPGNGGDFAFEPVAVRVDPGTTVMWEWTGKGDAHSLAAADRSFDADLVEAAGATYALQFDGVGVSKYTCPSHAAEAMRGAVVVGNPMAGLVDISPSAAVVGTSILGAALSPLAFGAFLAVQGTDDDIPSDTSGPDR